MDLKSSEYIVTGGAGWLGQGVLEALTRGLSNHPDLKDPVSHQNIWVLILPHEDWSALKARYPGINVVLGDIRRKEDCDLLVAGRKDAILIHTAGVIHPRNVRQFYEVNLNGTQNLLEASVKHSVKKAVIISSNEPQGQSGGQDDPVGLDLGKELS